MKKHIIFDNYDIYNDDAMKEQKEILMDSGYTEDEVTDDMIYNALNDDNSFWFDSVIQELRNIGNGNTIIAIADIGRWNGRFSGYKEYSSLEEIAYTDCDYETIYVDGYGNLRKDESHHDGNNHILYRYWKNDITDEQRDNFLDMLYNGTATSKDITRYTKAIGKDIADYYGWSSSKKVA